MEFKVELMAKLYTLLYMSTAGQTAYDFLHLLWGQTDRDPEHVFTCNYAQRTVYSITHFGLRPGAPFVRMLMLSVSTTSGQHTVLKVLIAFILLINFVLHLLE